MIETMFVLALIANANAADTRETAAVNRCLTHWGEHPFGDTPAFRVLAPSVRVLGFGSEEVVEKATAKPELVLVEPTVSVLTKTTWKLHNPNGWYCFNATVGVLAKVVIDADCSANLADSRSGATVLARTDLNGGVQVLGDIEVMRTCAGGAPPAPVAKLAMTISSSGVGPYQLGAAARENPPEGVTQEMMTDEEHNRLSICAIRVTDPRHRTADGLGVGSTLADFDKAYGKGTPEQIGESFFWYDKAGFAVRVADEAFPTEPEGSADPKTPALELRVGGCPE